MPFRSFSHYAGLQGNLLCAYSFGNTVYAGTSLGLFKLQKEDVYDELVYYVDVEIPRKRGSRKKQEVSEPKTKPEQKVEETESKKGGFFSFLRKKKKDQPQQVQTSPVIIHEPDITETVILEKKNEHRKFCDLLNMYSGRFRASMQKLPTWLLLKISYSQPD
jgi:hypothetical protein